MAHRGTEYNFEPGEYVLCFEPDCTKARVLYDAKVLDLAGSQDKRGNWKTEYTVHFQGWNSSWDRIVPETFIQKNSAENRALMKRLAVVARNVRSNHSRKRKIDILLKQHFGRKMPADSSSDSSSDSDNTEDDADEDDDDDLTDVDNFEDNGKGNQSTTEDETENGANNEESDDDKEYSDGLELHGPHDIELDLPCELRTKLEDDCYFITKKKRLVLLPADPNVLSVLEGYVKNFALNILYGTVEKPRLRDHQSHLPERNIDLCKEVMDGLRVIFDFCLPSVLLYDNERAQYEGLAARYKPVLPMKKEVEEAPPAPEVTSPRLRSSTRQTMSPDATGGGDDASQHLPHLSPRSTKRERDDTSDDDMPARRMTRHAYQAEIRYRKPTEPRPKASGQPEGCLGSTEKRRSGHTPRLECSDGGGNTETRRRESLRSSTRHSSELLHGTAAALGLAQKNVSLTDRVTPPPPLLIPSVISSKASKGSSSPHHTPTYKSRCSTPTLTDKEGLMNGVLAWKLIPDDAYQQIPPAPSQMCGAIHLLRLFVKLPELVNQMTIPESSVKPLVKHLWLLQEYMADNCEDLFPDSAYTDASDSLRGSASKR